MCTQVGPLIQPTRSMLQMDPVAISTTVIKETAAHVEEEKIRRGGVVRRKGRGWRGAEKRRGGEKR